MTQDALVKMVFNGSWLIRTVDGGYLDVTFDEDAGMPRMLSVPFSRLRHRFRIQQVQDVRTREWSVTLEPVPLVPPPTNQTLLMAAGTSKPAAALIQLPMRLAHLGCVHFSLKPETAPTSLKTSRASAGKPAKKPSFGAAFVGLPPTLGKLSLDVDLATLAVTDSTVPFPAFDGEARQAFENIQRQLNFDPHGPKLDEAALARLKRPADIKSEAWDEVIDQLRLEIHYRFLCGQYFSDMMTFVQNVFISNSNLVETVGGYIKLDGNALISLSISGFFGLVAAGIGAVPLPGASVVSGGLKVAFQLMLRDRGPSETTLTTALANARERFSEEFNRLITAVQNLRSMVYVDWGKLQLVGKSLEGDGGLFQWPKEDQELRNEARRAMEISLWKALLKVKWHHMTSDNDPGFLLKYTETDKATFEKANPNHWVEFHPGTHDEGFGKKRNGFFVTHHWLGYGSEAIWHHQPEPSMCDRLFKDLNVSRQEVFKDDSWGLVSESLHCPESRDAPNFHGGM